ncbi:ElaB/YqjD/DUF883 family membrane-anchored ribosome-binding protein [Nocardia transvalensis]|uniref:ElaB/YqjD/DUF883 family membrane-anchored ribosome-binding protein n=1 Tax=Nocardia transvalensis TaxID=37333 RepID=A0A7W9PJT9_9NOCA|nr:hypothetical protein [Nocardia transvalensis]MBB5917435.1 ElaB/YqjD/DUF883 family membrane-anchored ribosome-binding protein [Nocardia transvalensis]
MVENLKAIPGEIAGLSKLLSDIGDDATKAATFIGQDGQPADWLHGPIIDQVVTPIREMASATKERIGDLGTTTSATGVELNKAAWMYADQDQKNYAALNNHTFLGPVGPGQPNTTGADVEAQGATEAFTSPVTYPKPEEFKLEKPQVNKEDTAALIAEVAPVLGDLNETVKSITRTAGNEIDPLGKCLEPIPGNWNEFRRIGEAFKVVGNALEACGKNLESGLKRVDSAWDGRAAISFNDWGNRQIAAMKWEGPVGRVLGDVFGVVADEIRAAVKTILQKLWDILNDQIDFTSVKGIFKTIGKKIPVVGQIAEVVDLGRKLFVIIDNAIQLVKKIQTLVDKIKKLTDFFKDPMGQLKDKAQQKLDETIAPFTESLEKASKKVAVTTDLAQIAQVNQTLNAPGTGYDVGAGNRPWDNG